MTHDDAKEAARLLLAAGVPREEITNEALVVADLFIQDMNRRLAQAIVEKFFPEWLEQQDHSPSQRSSRSRRVSERSE